MSLEVIADISDISAIGSSSGFIFVDAATARTSIAAGTTSGSVGDFVGKDTTLGGDAFAMCTGSTAAGRASTSGADATKYTNTPAAIPQPNASTKITMS